MPKHDFRQSLSIPGLLKNSHILFEQVPDNPSRCSIPLAGQLMSSLAIFSLKYPSLLQFDQDRTDDLTRTNLNSLYGIPQAPCHTSLREGWKSPSKKMYLLSTNFRAEVHSPRLLPYVFILLDFKPLIGTGSQ